MELKTAQIQGKYLTITMHTHTHTRTHTWYSLYILSFSLPRLLWKTTQLCGLLIIVTYMCSSFFEGILLRYKHST